MYCTVGNTTSTFWMLETGCSKHLLNYFCTKRLVNGITQIDGLFEAYKTLSNAQIQAIYQLCLQNPLE